MIYKKTNENLPCIIRGLDVQPNDYILAVGGSGDQALALLEYAERVLAVDIETRQVTHMKNQIDALSLGDYEVFIKKRLKLLQILLGIASVILVLEINLINQNAMVLNFILICVTSFIVAALFIIQTTLFLEYSSILGRGRVLSFIYIEMIVFLFSLLSLI